MENKAIEVLIERYINNERRIIKNNNLKKHYESEIEEINKCTEEQIKENRQIETAIKNLGADIKKAREEYNKEQPEWTQPF